MALIPIPCTESTIALDGAEVLVWPPPFNFGLGGYDGAGIERPVEFDFTPLRDDGNTAAVQYFTYSIGDNAHDWAMAGDVIMNIDRPTVSLTWPGTEFLHVPPPVYEVGSGVPAQLFDNDLKTITDHDPSPPFGPFARYLVQPSAGALSGGILVMNQCGFTPVRFSLFAFFQYYWFIRTNLAYDTHATAPVLTLGDLTAWCSVTDPWPCAGDCGEVIEIASGHSADVCMQSKWVRDDALPNGGSGGIIRPPGQFAPVGWTDVGGINPIINCLLHVTIGCLTAAMIAAAHFRGPYQIAFILNDHCTFDNVPYTRVLFSRSFAVTADTICPDDGHGITGNPFNLQDKHGRYHSIGTHGPNVEYRRSDFGTNAVLGWTVSSSIAAPGGKSLHDPRVIVDLRQTVRLCYARQILSGGAWEGVYLADSNDDGRTWEAGVLAIPGGKHPTVAYGQDGAFFVLVVAAYVGPDGGPGVITAKIQAAGDAALGSAFNFKDDAGADLVAADDTFHIQQAPDEQGRWMLHVKISGDTETSQWSSYDETATWTRVV